MAVCCGAQRYHTDYKINSTHFFYIQCHAYRTQELPGTAVDGFLAQFRRALHGPDDYHIHSHNYATRKQDVSRAGDQVGMNMSGMNGMLQSIRNNQGNVT